MGWAVAPEPVQQDRELAGDGDLGLLETLRLAIARPHSRNAQVRLIFTSSTFAAS